MDELGLEKAALVGNSGRGGAALQFAAQWPERVSHLITMGSGLPTGGSLIFSPAGMTEGIRILLETYRDPSPENLRRLVSIMVFDSAFVTDELCRMLGECAETPGALGQLSQNAREHGHALRVSPKLRLARFRNSHKRSATLGGSMSIPPTLMADPP
jgi:pimeloyl-ACP methyl ester carboxylesterase